MDSNNPIPFDAPFLKPLLHQMEQAAPADMAAWRKAEADEFVVNFGSRGLPDRALMERLINRLGDMIRSDDKYAGARAFSVLRGHVLRRLLAEPSDLRPAEARGRIMLTEPRTATDEEIASLFAAYRHECPEAWAEWRALLIKLDKYYQVNGRHTALTVALENAHARSNGQVRIFLRAHSWTQSSYALTTAVSDVRDLLLDSISAEELVLTPADEELRVVLPSDEDVLAYLEGFDFGVDVREFTVTVRNPDELRALVELTAEVMEAERKSNWDARATARSSDAGHHAACFRIMKELHEKAHAAWLAARA